MQEGLKARGKFFNAIRSIHVAAWLAGILLLVYIINCFTPLRLTNDTIRYFQIKEWIEAGRPSGGKVGSDFLPHGYVYFLILLSKAGMAKSFVICLVHLFYFIGSLWFVKKIFPDLKFWPFAVLAMLSWAILKFVITPLSEMQFLFFSVGALFFFRQFETAKKIHFLVRAILFAAVAILTRSAGIVLIFAFMVSFLLRLRGWIPGQNNNKWKWAGITGIVVAMFTLVKYVLANQYSSFLRIYFTNQDLQFYIRNFYLHLVDWASIFLNAPAPKIDFLFPPQIRDSLYAIAGILFLIWILFLLFRQKKIPILIRIYLLAYLLLVFFWPFYEPRFWVPIIPFLLALLLRQPVKTKPVRILRLVIATVYILVGVSAISYYTYTSIDKKSLSIKQDASRWQKEYETYFFGKTSDSTKATDSTVLSILRKYN